MTITIGKYIGRTGTIESNVHQRILDFPDEHTDGHHVMLDSGKFVTVSWDQVKS